MNADELAAVAQIIIAIATLVGVMRGNQKAKIEHENIKEIKDIVNRRKKPR